MFEIIVVILAMYLEIMSILNPEPLIGSMKELTRKIDEVKKKHGTNKVVATVSSFKDLPEDMQDLVKDMLKKFARMLLWVFFAIIYMGFTVYWCFNSNIQIQLAGIFLIILSIVSNQLRKRGRQTDFDKKIDAALSASALIVILNNLV